MRAAATFSAQLASIHTRYQTVELTQLLCVGHQMLTLLCGHLVAFRCTLMPSTRFRLRSRPRFG